MIAQAARADSPIGVWLTQDGRARIRTELCGPEKANLCGYAVWSKTSLDDDGRPFLDKLNPDPEKRTRSLLGHQLIMVLQRNDSGRYEGKIYNATNGKFYDVQIWSANAGNLTVEGCLLGVLCGSQSWKRVTDIAVGQLKGATNALGGPRSDPEWADKGAK